MIEYDSFPLVKFWKILENEETLSDHNISQKDWVSLKEKWQEDNPSPESGKVLEATRSVMLEDLRLKTYVLLAHLISDKEGDYSEHYNTLAIKYHETHDERVSYLEKNITKTAQKLKIFVAKKKQLEESIKLNQEGSDEPSDIYTVLASFEVAGISIGRHEDLTLGRYRGLNKAYERKAELDKRNGG